MSASETPESVAAAVAGADEVPGVPELPKVDAQLCPPKSPGIGRVVSNELCTQGGKKSAAFVRHVVVDVSGTPIAGAFRPGQSFGVIPPGLDEREKPHKQRLYSIASPSRGEIMEGYAPGALLSTTCKRVLDEHWESKKLFLGRCSNYICDLAPGDELKVTGPAGKKFLLPVDPSRHDFVFFATGTGIAPFRGMVLELLEAGVGSRIVLVLGVPFSVDLMYHDEFTALAEQHENFTYLTAISRETQKDVDRRLYVQDRISTHDGMFGEMFASERTLVYMCGLAGMELGIFSKLAEVAGPKATSQYLRVDPEVAADPASWRRDVLAKQVRPTKRMFVEVY